MVEGGGGMFPRYAFQGKRDLKIYLIALLFFFGTENAIWWENFCLRPKALIICEASVKESSC